MQMHEIPLRGVSERFGLSLPDGVALSAAVTWRNRGGAGWVLDLATSDGVALVSGVPLVTGCDLLQQFQHLGIPGALLVLSDGADPGAEPTFDNLGTDARLYYVLP